MDKPLSFSVGTNKYTPAMKQQIEKAISRDSRFKGIGLNVGEQGGKLVFHVADENKGHNNVKTKDFQKWFTQQAGKSVSQGGFFNGPVTITQQKYVPNSNVGKLGSFGSSNAFGASQGIAQGAQKVAMPGEKPVGQNNTNQVVNQPIQIPSAGNVMTPQHPAVGQPMAKNALPGSGSANGSVFNNSTLGQTPVAQTLQNMSKPETVIAPRAASPNINDLLASTRSSKLAEVAKTELEPVQWLPGQTKISDNSNINQYSARGEMMAKESDKQVVSGQAEPEVAETGKEISPDEALQQFDGGDNASGSPSTVTETGGSPQQ